MKIALICTEKLPVPPIAGGAVQLYIEGIVPYLSRKHDITVFSIQYPGLAEHEIVDNVKYIRVPGNNNTTYINSLKTALSNSFDLIHVFNRPRYVLELMECFPGVRFGLSLHNEMFHPEKVTDAEGLRCIDRVEYINTVSKYIANTVIARFPSAESKLRVVYSGVDSNIYKPVWSTEGLFYRNQLKRKLGLQDYKVVLYVGRLSVKKGVDILLRAMDQVMHYNPKTALVIIGSKWYGKNEEDDYTKALRVISGNLTGPIVFTGFIPPADIPKYFTIGDVFVCASQWKEPLARVHYEAMAAGLPIITTNRGGNAEVVAGYGNGFVIDDYSNPVVMAQKISYLLNNEVEALKMGGSGRRLAEQWYTWERVANDVLQAFTKDSLSGTKATAAIEAGSVTSQQIVHSNPVIAMPELQIDIPAIPSETNTIIPAEIKTVIPPEIKTVIPPEIKAVIPGTVVQSPEHKVKAEPQSDQVNTKAGGFGAFQSVAKTGGSVARPFTSSIVSNSGGPVIFPSSGQTTGTGSFKGEREVNHIRFGNGKRLG